MLNHSYFIGGGSSMKLDEQCMKLGIIRRAKSTFHKVKTVRHCCSRWWSTCVSCQGFEPWAWRGTLLQTSKTLTDMSLLSCQRSYLASCVCKPENSDFFKKRYVKYSFLISWCTTSSRWSILPLERCTQRRTRARSSRYLKKKTFFQFKALAECTTLPI